MGSGSYKGMSYFIKLGVCLHVGWGVCFVFFLFSVDFPCFPGGFDGEQAGVGVAAASLSRDGLFDQHLFSSLISRKIDLCRISTWL